MSNLKLTTAQIDKICDKVKNGVPIRHAVRAAGVASSSFYYHFNHAEEIVESIEKGEAQLSELTRKERKLLEFLEKVEEAKSKCVDRNCALIQVAAASTWQAAAWWLERTVPESFGRRDTIATQHSGEVKTNYAMIEIEKMTPQQRKDLGEKLDQGIDSLRQNDVEIDEIHE